MKIVDLNVLIYAVNQSATHHERVKAWWQAALNGDESIGLPWVVVLGFLRIATNPKLFSAPLTVTQAVDCIDAWLGCEVTHLVRDKPEQWRLLAGLLSDSGAAGNLTTDAHLAATAIAHSATLVSCDTDFARFAGLRWESPLRER